MPNSPASSGRLIIPESVLNAYPDVLTREALDTLEALAGFNAERRQLMKARVARRMARFRDHRRIGFLDPGAVIARTRITVEQARRGDFEGSEIPHDLQRQWIQGTGPATRPRAPLAVGLRNVAYALLSGADGWMFDGEDALGQVDTMSLDNQRNLKVAFAQEDPFPGIAASVAAEMNTWARGFLGRDIVADWKRQLDFTTRIYRPRGLHLDDRHVRDRDGGGFSASIVDAVLYTTGNRRRLQSEGRSLVLYLPKIQTAEEAALWGDFLGALEQHLGLTPATIKVYVLVEQLEASYQLMEIRAALGRRFVGFNTGRWDYINSVADALAWDSGFQNPNIDAITMTYGYMRVYEDRVRRAVNTPDRNGRFALWQGGMEPNIPVGSQRGVADGMKRAAAGGEREQQAGASGKWVAHWKMVHIVRPVWENAGAPNQMGRSFAPLSYLPADAEDLVRLEPGSRTVRGARDLLSVALQYGNAFGRGFQAAALKPADFFGNDDVLYLMEDMATGEIRLSILWEWVHKRARFTEPDADIGIQAGEPLTPTLVDQLLREEYDKLAHAANKDVHDDSKSTTLPIAREIVRRYIKHHVKPPWYIDLLNLNLNNHDFRRARERVNAYLEAFERNGTRLTANPDASASAEAAATAEAH
jgi:malate synthase